VSFCVLVFDQDVVSFREEREKREPPKKPKRKEKILSVQKIRVPLLLLLFSVPKKNEPPKNEGGLQIFSGSCRKLFRITQL